MSETPEPEVAENDGEDKRKRRLLWLAFAGVPIILASSLGIVAATQGATTAASVSAEGGRAEEADPKISPGALEEQGEAAPSTERLIDTTTGEDAPVIETLWPMAPTDPSPIVQIQRPVAPTTGDPATPISPPVAPPTVQPAPSPSPGSQPSQPSTPEPQPSPDPTKEPTVPGDETETPEPGDGADEPTDPSTPQPGDDSEAETPGGGVDPENPADPGDEKPSTGGENIAKAQVLSPAIQLEAYHLLMHVKGNFDLEGATWRVTQGELPEGLEVDPATGTISGRTTAAPGRYVFQLEVENATNILRGWFLMMVASPIEPKPEPGEGPIENPGPNPGNGEGEDGGSEPTNPSTPEEPTDPTTPGDGTTDPVDPVEPTDPVDPIDPVDPGEGTQPVDPGEGTDPVDPEPEEPTTPTEPTDPVDPTDPGAETPTDPQPGDGTEVEPTDPEIDPGAGGIKIDKLEFVLSPVLTFTVGTAVDIDLGATSSTGLAISYSAEGLPSWLSVIDGRLQGVAPTVTGSFNITVTATNEKNRVVQSAAVHVAPAQIVLDTTPLAFTSGEGRVIDLQATNGASNSNFAFRIISAQNAQASLEGSSLTAMYTLPGSYELLIEVEDVNSPIISRNTFRIPVEVEPVALTVSTHDVEAVQYVATSGAFTAAGGWGGYYFRVVDGALPAGVALKFDGTFSGAARETGSFTVSIEVTDNQGWTATEEVTFTVKANPAITPAGSFDVTSGATGLAYTGEGQQMLVASSQKLSLVDTATNTVLKQVAAFNGSPKTARLSPDGRLYAILYSDRVQVYDAALLTKVSEFSVRSPLDFLWSPDGSKIYVAWGKTASSAELQSYDSATGQLLGGVSFGKSPYYWKLHLTADGRILANAVSQKEVYEIDPSTMTSRVLLEGSLNVMTTSSDGTLWGVTGATIKHYAPSTGELLGSWTLSGVAISNMLLSPDGRWLYMATNSGLLVFDTKDGVEVVRVPIGAGNASNPQLAVSADGRTLLVTAGSNKTAVYRFTAEG